MGVSSTGFWQLNDEEYKMINRSLEHVNDDQRGSTAKKP